MPLHRRTLQLGPPSLVLVVSTLASCAPSAASAPALAPARAAFVHDRICPADRVTLHPRPDIATTRIAVVGDAYKRLPPQPPATDPERMSLWDEQRREASKVAASWRIEEATGCGESTIYACHETTWPGSRRTPPTTSSSCVPLKEVVTLEEMIADRTPQAETDALATAGRDVADLQARLDAAKALSKPKLRSCSDGEVEMDLGTACILRFHALGRGDPDSMVAETGRACSLPSRESMTPVPLTNLAARATFMGDHVNLRISGKDPNGAPVHLALSANVERAPASEACGAR